MSDERVFGFRKALAPVKSSFSSKPLALENTQTTIPKSQNIKHLPMLLHRSCMDNIPGNPSIRGGDIERKVQESSVVYVPISVVSLLQQSSFFLFNIVT